MEYQCFYLDPTKQLAHDETNIPLYESNSLPECCGFVYALWNKEHADVAVYQPRTNSYREIYRNPARNGRGQFCKR
jgi:hypothetical protein